MKLGVKNEPSLCSHSNIKPNTEALIKVLLSSVCPPSLANHKHPRKKEKIILFLLSFALIVLNYS
jgi:hypothetical protein